MRLKQCPRWWVTFSSHVATWRPHRRLHRRSSAAAQRPTLGDDGQSDAPTYILHVWTAHARPVDNTNSLATPYIDEVEPVRVISGLMTSHMALSRSTLAFCNMLYCLRSVRMGNESANRQRGRRRPCAYERHSVGTGHADHRAVCTCIAHW